MPVFTRRSASRSDYGPSACRASPRRGAELQPRLEALEFEVSNLRRELSETQERLDFAERVLAQGQESRRLDPQR